MKLFAIVFLATIALTAAQSLDDCFKQDSISCVQKTIYRKAKEFFDKDNLEIVSGVSLVRSNAESESRKSRSGKELVYDEEIDAATDIVERQNVIENFVSEKVTGFLGGRSLKVNLAPAFEQIGESARAISESIPQEVRQAADEVVEGRGKKKLLKSILPLLIAAKVKIGALATLAYFAIALLAKKAILASLISIAISAFLGLKSLWASKSGHDITPYSGPWGGAHASAVGGGYPVSSGGWNTVGTASWDDHSYAQNQAYSGYHHRR